MIVVEATANPGEGIRSAARDLVAPSKDNSGKLACGEQATPPCLQFSDGVRSLNTPLFRSSSIMSMTQSLAFSL